MSGDFDHSIVESTSASAVAHATRTVAPLVRIAPGALEKG